MNIAYAYIAGVSIAIIWALIAILVKQSEKKGAALEQREQAENAVDVLKNQAVIANRADVDRDELYARLRGKSRGIVSALPRDEPGSSGHVVGGTESSS